MQPANDQGHVGLGRAEHAGDCHLAYGAGETTDSSNFVGREKFAVHSNAPDIDGVLSVSLVINPLKICGRVVPLHAVDVVDEGKMLGIWDKCKSYQSVNEKCLFEASREQIHMTIPQAVGCGPQHFSVNPARPQPAGAYSVKTSDAAKVTDFVESHQFGDVNGSPFFNGCGSHAAGHPSGLGGSVIKNPSRARTLGGFAIRSTTAPALQPIGG
jgi:hypothetical protein